MGVIIFDDELKKLTEEMAELMYASAGVGLAAPQIGVSLRVLVIDSSNGEEPNKLLVMINPVITWASPEKHTGEEACLSMPGIFLQVNRSVSVKVEYHDVMGNVQRLECDDRWLSRIIQHEIDHLNGKTMLDRIGFLARKMALKGLK